MKATIAVLLVILISLATNVAFAKGVDVDAKSITVSIYQEPRSLDSISSPSVEFTGEVLVHIQEGLMRYDARRRLVGGVAESWEMTSEEIRFTLRGDARWQNGEPVTAADFIFAWRKVVSPEGGSPSATLATPIKNAGSIIRGELPPEELGVTSPSPRELIVELEHPCNWCLKVMTTSVFYPVNEAFYNSVEKYGTSPETHLSNGPFTLASWQRGMRFSLAKNDQYWGRDRVDLNRINFDYISTDAKSLLNLYRSGELAVISLDRDTVSRGLELGQRIRSYPTGYLMNIQFAHVDGMLSANEHIRKVVALVIDKEDLVNRVVGIPGTRVADSMFHDWLAVGDSTFASVVDVEAHETDLSLAREHLKKARQELDIDGDISLTFTIFDNSTMRRVAEYLQERLGLIGINLKVDPQSVQMLIDKWYKGTSDMTLIGWIPDVNDPIDQISFLGNPDIRKLYQGLYAGEDMTSIYFDYRSATSPKRRIEVIRRAHHLFNERVNVFPLFELYDSTLVDPRLRGYIFQPVRAFSDYRYMRIVGNP